MLNYEEIKRILPHRYPFLLVDRVTEMEPGKWIRGYKNVSGNEEFFQGHFPAQGIMPGVLMVEALAQLGAVTILSQPEHQGKLALFAGIESLRFKRPVVPGDRLEMEVKILSLRRGIGRGAAIASVEGEVAVKGEILFALTEGTK